MPTPPNTTTTTTIASPEGASGYVDPNKKVEPEVKPEDKPVKEPEVKDPSTGYKKVEGEPEVKPEVKTVPEVKPGDKTPEQILKEEIDTALGDLPDKETISAFAIEHKLTKDQVQAYVGLRKSEDAKFLQDNADRVKETREGWTNELKDDPDFGGENFDKNVDRVEKVYDEYMPNTKKALTGKGNVLPPYIMRDLLSLSKTLNPTTDLITGDASVPAKKEENFLDTYYE